ncbi:SDR family oxidoreductase [Bacillus sp. FJAT-49736]|uniref:elongation factor P 5-aminopentanone reductase n=1 Tax=Bacillus sp. FJAT-49736 TaxID=2833582 RepID=UPI001BC8E1B1|nr:SDR family oxidoreductase [Bacillus sp. FJAT-49736]MBS4172586.1 SDR family oxidoreductase [Bacillus sp. FJAT-49736]
MKKYVLITGASGGIGKETAIYLAKKGWNLYLHYHQNKKEIEDIMHTVESYPIEIIPIQADLSSPHGVEKVLNNIFHIDAVCFISGIAHYGLFVDTIPALMEDMWNIHVHAPMLLTRKLLPKLMKNEASHIIFVSSIWGQTGASCEVVYSTVKGAQIAFVKALSKEVARSGVKVNAVAPGAVKTNMLANFSDMELQELETDIPLGRLADPKEIAGTIAFLLSDEASYITGHVLAVNGGWYT